MRLLTLLLSVVATSFAGTIGSGTTSATFSTPTPSCSPTATTAPRCTGMGTNAITWGVPFDPLTDVSSGLTFFGTTFTDVAVGDTFVAGTVHFTNGTIYLATGITGFNLNISTTSQDPQFVQTLTVRIQTVSTPGNPDPLADADFIYFPDFPELGSFRVLEGQSTTVDVLARFGSLELVGFGDVGDPSKGFVSNSAAPVPEPASVWLIVGGLSLLPVLRGKFRS